MCGLTCGDG